MAAFGFLELVESLDLAVIGAELGSFVAFDEFICQELDSCEQVARLQ